MPRPSATLTKGYQPMKLCCGWGPDCHLLLTLMEKDLAYAQAEASGVELTTAANARQLFARAVAAGYSQQDMSTVVEVFRLPPKP